MPKPSSPLLRATESTSRLVDVPISVVVPPRTQTYDKGISNFLGLTLIAWARRMMIGIMTTTTGVLFMNAEAT
jgi:hypothetical protein